MGAVTTHPSDLERLAIIGAHVEDYPHEDPGPALVSDCRQAFGAFQAEPGNAHALQVLVDACEALALHQLAVDAGGYAHA